MPDDDSAHQPGPSHPAHSCVHPHVDHHVDHHAGHHAGHPPGLAELLELDGAVLASYLVDAVAWVEQLLPADPRHVLDLGTGTGTGALALARRFATAEVTAVDADPAMLVRVQEKVDRYGLADRLRPLRLDLDADRLPTDEVDLVWMALALHELRDPGRLFDAVGAALAPGGAFAVVEMDALPRFLPDDLGLGRPGFETRCHAAVADQQGVVDPHPDWGLALGRAGFTLLDRHRFAVDLASPVTEDARRYAELSFERVRPALEPRLDAEDRRTLDLLLGDGPQSLRHRADLVVHGSRTGWLVRPDPC